MLLVPCGKKCFRQLRSLARHGDVRFIFLEDAVALIRRFARCSIGAVISGRRYALRLLDDVLLLHIGGLDLFRQCGEIDHRTSSAFPSACAIQV